MVLEKNASDKCSTVLAQRACSSSAVGIRKPSRLALRTSIPRTHNSAVPARRMTLTLIKETSSVNPQTTLHTGGLLKSSKMFSSNLIQERSRTWRLTSKSWESVSLPSAPSNPTEDFMQVTLTDLENSLRDI
jgi:hypothetical protein